MIAADHTVSEDESSFRELRDVLFMGNQNNGETFIVEVLEDFQKGKERQEIYGDAKKDFDRVDIVKDGR